MKTNRSILTFATLAAFIGACEEREVLREDSPYITVNSPTRNQTIEDKDSVMVKAVIEPKNTSVVSYHIWLIDNEKNTIYNRKTDCNCEGMVTVPVKASFQYDIKKTSDLLLHIDAVLKDGTNLREELPFILADIKK